MAMQPQKFNASYDMEGDTLTFYRDDAVQESVEVTDELIIDLDKHKNIVNVELLNAYQFLHTLNEIISKEMLADLKEVEINVKRYRNYWILLLSFEYHNQRIEEKLPAFAAADFKSPLIAASA